MKRQDFNNKFNRIGKSSPEINSGEEKVSCVGFIPRARQIETLIQAGKRLEIMRGKYDVTQDKFDIDEIDIDPTRSKSFDLADASEFLTRLGILDFDLDKGTYTDKKGNIRKIFSGADKAVNTPENAQDGPDTSSRSVSGQMTPEGGGIDEKEKKDDNVEIKKK